MRRRLAFAAAVGFVAGLVALPTGTAQAGPTSSPGAPGVGDPYFPLDGNGGYEVKSYDLDLSYDPPPTCWRARPCSPPGRGRTCRPSTSTSRA